jgi:serine/threonine protein kinase/Tfp pilus assembly protein PilF
VSTTPAKRACSRCGTLLPEEADFCPVCALQQAAQTQSDSVSDTSSEFCFDQYRILSDANGTPIELGHGAMGVTYKAFDVHLQCPVALKIINARYIGDASARHRFVREARAAAIVRHPNVASVLHLGESGRNYFYAMEFVDGETLETLIRKSGRLEIDLALEVATQVADGLTGIEKQHLVHRDIKPSNIMLSWEQGRLESVKIIDLGLAKGVAEQDTISVPGSFVGTPAYASPEQFAGLGTDVRSDLYSLGVTLWEMVSGSLPFQGSAAELMYEHQHAAPPVGELKNVPDPVIELLGVLLEKDPRQRLQTPAQLQRALTKVQGAISTGSRLAADDLRSPGDRAARHLPKGKRKKKTFRWVLGAGICLALILTAWFFYTRHFGSSNQQATAATAIEKSIAVLPFENISPNKDDAYFADGVQDEILNNLAKIAQLKVISRTSVMQFRADSKRDLRQIANALGVANVLEGTVRREGNHVRVSTELVDARNDNTIWADSYDRELTDIFAIQSEVAQTIATKLTAKLSPEEKRTIERKPTENLDAYDLYLRADELIQTARTSMAFGNVDKPLTDAVGLLDQAVELDPKFTLAYCGLAKANNILYRTVDPTPERSALVEEAINNAMRLQPDLPEVHFVYAIHLYQVYRDYEQARVQLAIAKRGLPNDTETMTLEAYMDRRQGRFEEAIQDLNEASLRDPYDSVVIADLALTLYYIRQFRAAEQAFDRLIELRPDQPMLKAQKPMFTSYPSTGDDASVRSALSALPASLTDDRDALNLRLVFALGDRDWPQVKELLEKMKGGDDKGYFAYGQANVPVRSYSILLARLQGEQPSPNASSAETREQLKQKVQRSPENALLLSQLAVVDALLNNNQVAISEAKHAAEMLPIKQDAVDGPGIQMNLAVVYGWTGDLDLAFAALSPLTKTPGGAYYGNLKNDPYWEPLRKDPRFDKLLAELAPRD